MDAPPSSSPQPPRLLVRTTIYTFVTVVTILVAVFLVLMLDLRARARREVAQSLEDARAVVAALDERRLAELQVQAAALAGDPTFAAALQKHRNEMGSFSAFEVRSSVEWIERQAQRVAEMLRADVAAVIDTRQLVIARAGPAARDWPKTLRPAAPRARDDTPVGEQVLRTGHGAFRVVSVPLAVRGAAVGSLVVADRLDARYAAGVSTVTRAATAVVASIMCREKCSDNAAAAPAPAPPPVPESPAVQRCWPDPRQ